MMGSARNKQTSWWCAGNFFDTFLLKDHLATQGITPTASMEDQLQGPPARAVSSVYMGMLSRGQKLRLVSEFATYIKSALKPKDTGDSMLRLFLKVPEYLIANFFLGVAFGFPMISKF